MTVQEPTNPSELFSPFLPTTQNIPEDEGEIKDFLNEKFSAFADVINDKSIGVINQAAENFSGLKAFYKTTKVTRNGFWTLAYIPSFTPQTLTLTSSPQFPIMGIDPNFMLWQTWGSASKPKTTDGTGDYFTFNPQGDARIQYSMTDNSLTITTDGARASYFGVIVIEYIRRGT